MLFTDNPERASLRAERLAAHVDWIASHPEQILVAGSLRNEPGDNPKGGLWIVEANAKADVLTLVQSDPFFKFGLRASVEVLHWSKAFPEQFRLV